MIFDFLKNHIPGFQNIRLLDSSARVGIRESRRVVGEYVLKHEDLLKETIFDDAIVILASTVDIHTSSTVIYTPRETMSPYSIPYRSIIAKDLDNVWMAGRNVSADRYAHGAVRVMPPSIAMGQAAGIAASLACKNNAKAKDVPYGELRAILMKQNAYLG